MLRSFHYAAATALLRATSERPDGVAALEPLVQAWETQVAQAFLDSYAERVRGSALYGDWPAARGLLGLFVLEKALYELGYELNNRPDWVRIPLRGLLALLAPPR
jgi:maltose alpha-D-glucosyltransferase/alpha-amylase